MGDSTKDIQITAGTNDYGIDLKVTVKALTRNGPADYRVSMTLDVDQTRDVIRKLTAALTMLGVEP